MSKLLPPISGVACFLWVSGWTWVFSAGKHSTAAGSNQLQSSIFIDSVRYEVQHPLAFEYSEATPIVVEKLHPALKSVVVKLADDPNSRLKITGIYSGTEENETSFPNLGQARAEAVKSILEASGAVGDRIETEGFEASNLFQVDGKLTGAIYLSFLKQKADYQAVKMNDEDEGQDPLEDAAAQSFYYKYGDYKVGKAHFGHLKKLRDELKNNPESSLLLTGYSGPEEEAESSRVNLAEMRALAIRRYLVDHGVRRAQIEVKAKPSMARSSQEMIVSIQFEND